MHRHRVAIMVDGGFFLKRMKAQFPDINHDDPATVARLIHKHALRHCTQRTGGLKQERYSLYRIFFYDCPPYEKKMHQPISKTSIDFNETKQAKFRRALHAELLTKRKVALRLGRLSDYVYWQIKEKHQKEIINKKLSTDDLTDDHFELAISQKGVDMRLGLDVASLTYKKLVDQIVLIVGDSDFVPASKLARREGIDIIIDPLGVNLQDGLNEHTDGKRTPKKEPQKANDEQLLRQAETYMSQLIPFMQAVGPILQSLRMGTFPHMQVEQDSSSVIPQDDLENIDE